VILFCNTHSYNNIFLYCDLNNTIVEDIVLQASFAEPALQIPGSTVVVAMEIEISSLTPASNGNDSSYFGTMKIVECFV
jgi:hypothetical protein